MRVYVIRHGLTNLNKKKILNGQIDEPLSPEGIEQAQDAISQVPESIKYIYCSPLRRARQTAEIINAKLKRPIYFKKNLTEIHMGSIAGKSWDSFEEGLEMKKKHRSIQFDYRKHGGESAEQVKERVLKFLQEIKGKHKDEEEVLIVTHGGVIRFFYLLGHGEVPYETEKHISPLIFNLDKILKNST